MPLFRYASELFEKLVIKEDITLNYVFTSSPINQLTFCLSIILNSFMIEFRSINNTIFWIPSSGSWHKLNTIVPFQEPVLSILLFYSKRHLILKDIITFIAIISLYVWIFYKVSIKETVRLTNIVFATSH